MSYKRLTPVHPLYQKVDKLHDALEELGLRICTEGDQVFIEDTETKLTVRYMDLEHVAGQQPTSEIPLPFEWKLIFRDDS